MNLVHNDSNIAVLSELVNDALRAAPMGSGPPLPSLLSRGAMTLAAPGPASSVVQLLSPMVPWDWPEAVAGSMSYQQFTFADSVPASVEPSVAYASTATSLSQNYTNFLRLLASRRFPLKAVLDDTLKRCAFPDGSPDLMIAPDGWACAPDSAGINRWRLAYGASMTPQEWLAQVAAGPSSEVQLTLPLAGNVVLQIEDDAGTKQAVALQDDVERATITARALSQVSLTPGRWYDATLLKLGRDGPFIGGQASAGPYAGLLNARVSALIVACDPVLYVAGPDNAASATNAALQGAAAVELGGFQFPAPEAVAPLATGGAVSTGAYAHRSQASGAWIVGVKLELFT